MDVERSYDNAVNGRCVAGSTEKVSRGSSIVDETRTRSLPMLLHLEDVRSLIPEFIPERITVEKWLRKLEKLKIVYNWDEQAVFHYASIRLGTVSRTWFEAVEEEIADWTSFKQRIARAFPTRIDEIDVHNALLNRMKRPDETYENFAYEIVSKARTVNISEAATIKYVINGITDSDLRVLLSIRTFDAVETLVDAIYCNESQSQMRTMVREASWSYFQDQNATRNEMRNTYSRCCFKCGQRGHIARTCHLDLRRRCV